MKLGPLYMVWEKYHSLSKLYVYNLLHFSELEKVLSTRHITSVSGVRSLHPTFCRPRMWTHPRSRNQPLMILKIDLQRFSERSRIQRTAALLRLRSTRVCWKKTNFENILYFVKQINYANIQGSLIWSCADCNTVLVASCVFTVFLTCCLYSFCKF